MNSGGRSRGHEFRVDLDVAAKRAAGIRVLLTFGGAGGYLAISRRAIATTFVSSLQAIIDSIGPVDGLDRDIEGGDLYPAEAKRSRRPWRQCSRGPVRAGFDGAQ